MLIIKLLAAVALAFLFGKLVSKIKLPAILGWLLAGMVLGPHALGLLDTTLLEAHWYEALVHILECAVGLLIGTELVWSKIKKSGKQIIITTLTQSLGTFAVVTLVFGIVFYFTGVPLYLAAVFGGIGSIQGAIIGGLFLGFAEIMTVALFPDLSGYRDAFAFVLLIVILLIKPTGLMGEKIEDKI